MQRKTKMQKKANKCFQIAKIYTGGLRAPPPKSTKNRKSKKQYFLKKVVLLGPLYAKKVENIILKKQAKMTEMQK